VETPSICDNTKIITPKNVTISIILAASFLALKNKKKIIKIDNKISIEYKI
jgi:hypothetical protein